MEKRIINSPTYKENVELSKVEYFLGNDIRPTTEERLNRQQLRSALSRAIAMLTPREQLVLSAFYGLGTTQLTFAEIGEKFGMKRERARQIQKKAVRHLRTNIKQSLREYYY